MYKATTRVEDVKLWGVKDDAMYLSELRSFYLSRDLEGITARFTDHNEERKYPDFHFAVTYPRSWSVQQIRMDLFARVATAERAYSLEKLC